MPVGLTEDQFNAVLDTFGLRAFSTYDFSQEVQAQCPIEWREIIDKHGAGGRGAGSPYTANTRVAQILDFWAKRKVLDKLDYRTAPENWGSPVIRYWSLDRDRLGGTRYPDEILDNQSYPEGAKTSVMVNRYERNPQARQKCIQHHGIKCCVCGFDFEDHYGPHGAGFIHVHHLQSQASVGETHNIDPIRDLRPVCPNCHAMIHLRAPQLSIEELKQFLGDAARLSDSTPNFPSVRGGRR